MEQQVKVTIVGDGATGKTCSLIRYCKGDFPRKYVPTVFEAYSLEKEVGGNEFLLNLMDTAGQEDYDQLRPCGYPNTDCVVMLYSAIEQASFSNIEHKWLPEIEHHLPNIPIVLACNKIDQRNDPLIMQQVANRGQQIIQRNHGEAFFQSYSDHKNRNGQFQQIVAFLEMSALTGQGLDDVFNTAMWYAYQNKFGKKNKKPSPCKIL